MASVKELVQDFKDYLDGLEKQELLVLLHNLVGDVDGLSVEVMYNILKRNKVEGYTADKLPTELL